MVVGLPLFLLPCWSWVALTSPFLGVGLTFLALGLGSSIFLLGLGVRREGRRRKANPKPQEERANGRSCRRRREKQHHSNRRGGKTAPLPKSRRVWVNLPAWDRGWPSILVLEFPSFLILCWPSFSFLHGVGVAPHRTPEGDCSRRHMKGEARMRREGNSSTTHNTYKRRRRVGVALASWCRVLPSLLGLGVGLSSFW